MKSLKKKVLTSVLAAAVIFPATYAFSPQGVTEAKTIEKNGGIDTLPLGSHHLPQTKKISQLAKGVTYTHIHRGYQSKHTFYTIDVQLETDKHKANRLEHNLKKKGYHAFIHEIDNTKNTDVAKKKIGYVVRVGHFQGKDQASKKANQLKSLGYGANVTYSDYDGEKKSTGPWDINVLEINPKHFQGRMASALGDGHIEGRERVSSMTKRRGAIAGINGGYFVTGPQDGTTGDLAGISVEKGKLISESVGNRPSLILSNGGNGFQAKIAHTQTELSVVAANGDSHVMDGVNRKPGLIRACGGVGDQPTDQPKHDFTCKDSSEIIAFTNDFGQQTPAVSGYEATIDSNGNVVSVSRIGQGSAIPQGGTVLEATGSDAAWLKSHAHVGDPLKVKKQLLVNGKSVPMRKSMDIVNGSPQLLKNGKITIDAQQTGFDWSPDFYYHFGLYRQPRTLAGIKADGTLILVTVDGRDPQKSIGVSFLESAKLMKSLGAISAINLDGGGSSTMVVNNKVVNVPSDPTGERPVGDGILIEK